MIMVFEVLLKGVLFKVDSCSILLGLLFLDVFVVGMLCFTVSV